MPEEGGDYVKSSRPRGQGFSRATMEITKRCDDVSRSKSEKFSGNWDYPLQLAGTTLNEEQLVIAYQHGAVNMLN